VPTTLPTSGNFFLNFASTQTQLDKYGFELKPGSGNAAQGDENSIYSSFYYSITNAQTLMTASGYCAFELVVVGKFPEVRYFSVADYDMHYAPAQHIADLDLDPVGCQAGASCGTTYVNPFIAGTPFTPGNQYMVPIGLGYIPTSHAAVV
jgi:hypothetical protein